MCIRDRERTGQRGTQHVAGHTDAVGRRYARESNVRLVRQSKTEAIDAVEMPAPSARDGIQSRRRDRAAAADAEASGTAYRSHHHQASDAVVEHAGGRSTTAGHIDSDSRDTVVTATGTSGLRYSGDRDNAERNRKSAKEMRPMERHSSMVSAVDERDVEVIAASSARRNTTGQVHDHRNQDTAVVDVRAANNALEVRRHGRPPADSSYSAERSRVLVAEVDKKTADKVVEVHRKTSPRRVNVDSSKDTERTRPSVTQSGGHVATYLSRRTNELHDKDRYA